MPIAPVGHMAKNFGAGTLVLKRMPAAVTRCGCSARAGERKFDQPAVQHRDDRAADQVGEEKGPVVLVVAAAAVAQHRIFTAPQSSMPARIAATQRMPNTTQRVFRT